MVKLVINSKCLKYFSSEPSAIVCYESVWNAMSTEVLLGGLDDS